MVDYAPNLNCRGSGGQQAHPAGSARGRARSHARSAHATHGDAIDIKCPFAIVTPYSEDTFSLNR